MTPAMLSNHCHPKSPSDPLASVYSLSSNATIVSPPLARCTRRLPLTLSIVEDVQRTVLVICEIVGHIDEEARSDAARSRATRLASMQGTGPFFTPWMTRPQNTGHPSSVSRQSRHLHCFETRWHRLNIDKSSKPQARAPPDRARRRARPVHQGGSA